MSGLLDLDAIREAHPLPVVAGAVIKLKRAGNELVGCCPFHPDKSPSFTVFNGGRRYHCFGCSADGDGPRTIYSACSMTGRGWRSGSAAASSF